MNQEKFDDLVLPGLPPGQRWKISKDPAFEHHIKVSIQRGYKEPVREKVGWFKSVVRDRWIWKDAASTYVDWSCKDPKTIPHLVKSEAEFMFKREQAKDARNMIIDNLVGVYESRKI